MQGGNPYKPVVNQMRGARNTMNAAYEAQQGGMQPVSRLADTDLQPYQNPFQSQVIDNTMNDMARANSMALEGVSAQATGAGAFGGSRHGIAEAETNRAFADRAGNMAANLRMQGFNNAQQGAMFDIGQEAALRGRQMQGASNLASMGTQRANLANLGFGMLNTVSDRQARDGAIRRGLNQAVIDAAKGQYGGFTGSPMGGLNAQIAALNAAKFGETTTSTSTPGLFDFLTLGASLGAGGV